VALHRLSMNVDNIDKRRSAVDVLEHIGSGGVFIDPDVSDRRPLPLTRTHRRRPPDGGGARALPLCRAAA